MSKFQLLTSYNTFFLQLRISQSMKTDRFYQKNRRVLMASAFLRPDTMG